MDGKQSPPDTSKLPDSPLLGKRTNVIRVAGIPQKATLFDGTVVHRKEILEFPMGEELKRVRAAPYDNHFCYVVPKHIQGWMLVCTCGGMAGVVGLNMYRKDASATVGGDGLVPGELAVCLSHANPDIMRHADGSS